MLRPSKPIGLKKDYFCPTNLKRENGMKPDKVGLQLQVKLEMDNQARLLT